MYIAIITDPLLQLSLVLVSLEHTVYHVTLPITHTRLLYSGMPMIQEVLMSVYCTIWWRWPVPLGLCVQLNSVMWQTPLPPSLDWAALLATPFTVRAVNCIGNSTVSMPLTTSSELLEYATGVYIVNLHILIYTGVTKPVVNQACFVNDTISITLMVRLYSILLAIMWTTCYRITILAMVTV